MVNRHNFVSLILYVPAQIQNSDNFCKIKYIPISLGYEMKTDNNNKLDFVITIVFICFIIYKCFLSGTDNLESICRLWYTYVRR